MKTFASRHPLKQTSVLLAFLDSLQFVLLQVILVKRNFFDCFKSTFKVTKEGSEGRVNKINQSHSAPTYRREMFAPNHCTAHKWYLEDFSCTGVFPSTSYEIDKKINKKNINTSRKM